MKKPLIIMLVIILVVLLLAGAGVGVFLYEKSSAKSSTQPVALTSTQLKSLLVDLPENTTNTKDGLIQFTAHLQAQDSNTKSELTDILPVVQDAVNQAMHQFSDDDLRTTTGRAQLNQLVLHDVNALLQSGKVTAVYFSTWVVQ